MNRRVIALYLLLIAVIGVLIRYGYGHWKQARSEQATVLNQPIAAKSVLPPPVPESAKPATPAEYFDVAQKTLFSKDRNPVVVIEPPPAKPEPPMPPLPKYYGQIAIGDPVAILSTANDPQKGYRAGEKIGEFKLIAFDREKITFEWNNKSVERKLADLVANDVAPQADSRGTTQPPPAVSSAKPAPASSGAITLGQSGASDQSGSTSLSKSSNSNPSLGEEITDGVRKCVPGDTSAPGAIINGYKKVVYTTMFGAVCQWEPTK